ncbi:hypothetical protein QP119_02755 [Corynebacterium frankenforstense]|uniref:hypothetical protein n=1 Tax=Corynebacterium frankenforstense TaxID=1230998 RepID=UPI002550ECE8|nr:hypothetical protein [Corynebacterium frankenforstense]MDK6259353.1 hypothetical protein [Corynebacterium frankenforstense]
MVGAVVSVVRSGENVAVAEVDVVEDSAEDGETQISGELVGAVVSGAPTLKRLQLTQPRTPTIASTATTPTASTAMTPAPGPPGCPSVAGAPPSGPRNSFSADMVPPSSRRGL